MAQQYYTLEEAAAILETSPDELKQMSKRGELRAFQDRGTLRFRSQDVQEAARRRGSSSNPEVPLGEAPRAKAGDSPPPKSGAKKSEETFGFSLEMEEPGGHPPAPPPARKSSLGSGSSKTRGTPKPASNSEVRLVSDGGDLDFKIDHDSDVKLEEPGKPPSTPPPKKSSGVRRDSEVKLADVNPAPAQSPPPRRKTGARRDSEVQLGDLAPASPQSPPPRRKTGAHQDSGVKLVDLGSDSDVKIIPAGEEKSGKKLPGKTSDSEIRLEGRDDPARKEDDSLLTEEIDLDAEIRKAEEAARAKPAKPPKGKQPEFPTTSPFELSETDLKLEGPSSDELTLPSAGSAESGEFVLSSEENDSSSDFDLEPAADSSSDFDLEPAADSSSDEFQLDVPSDADVALGDMPPAKRSNTGINLQDPADSGISLEKGEGSDELDFELTLDAESTPRPASATNQADSDSEFELTIDETGGLAPLEEEAVEEVVEDKDIFETDFEVPALDEESGSQAIALDDADTDLDSSDFDIALSEGDVAVDDESGSQVVALEEEGEEGGVAVEEGPSFDSLLVEEAVGEEAVVEEEEEEEPEPVAVAAAPEAPWGPLPALLMLPCVLILVLVGLLGFEMLQSLAGYHRPGVVTRQISKIMGLKLPPE